MGLSDAHPWPAPLTSPLLLSSESQALQCYSFQHTYFGPFDLSGMKLANISCPSGCSEAVMSLDTGEEAGRKRRQRERSQSRREGGGGQGPDERLGREGGNWVGEEGKNKGAVGRWRKGRRRQRKKRVGEGVGWGRRRRQQGPRKRRRWERGKRRREEEDQGRRGGGLRGGGGQESGVRVGEREEGKGRREKEGKRERRMEEERGGRDLKLEGDGWRAEVRRRGGVGEQEEGGGGGRAPGAIPSRPQGTAPR